MRGVVNAISSDGSYGQIAADDGNRYSYWTSEIRNGAAYVGTAVNFEMASGQPVDIFILPPPASADAPAQQPAKPQPGGRGQLGFASIRSAVANGAQAMAAAVPAGSEVAAAGRVKVSPGTGFPPMAYWLQLYSSPSGRISRREFWLFGVLGIVAASIVLGWIPVVGQLLMLFLLWGSICIAFKRFHDLGYPGWYCFAYLVPMVLAGVMIGIGFYSLSFIDMAWLIAEILWAVGALIGLAQIIFVYARPGQPGPNQYGPDPLAG